MADTQNNNTFSHRTMWDLLMAKRKSFYWGLSITFIVSSVLILSIPRYWKSKVTLSPETSTGSLGGIGSLASSFGLDVGSNGAEDAIHPNLYPEVVKSKAFLVGLFNVQIQTSDNSYSGDYYTYLSKHRKQPWWKYIKVGIVRMTYLVRKPNAGGRPGSSADAIDPFWLNRKQSGIVTLMQENIVCSVDKKTDVITIVVKDQDKLVAALIADSVRMHLQEHITIYRTQKAQQDVEYYNKMLEESYAEYKEAAEHHIQYIDSHSGMHLERYRAEAELLERERDTKFAAYESFKKQGMAASAKLQERTPVFAVLSSASVSEIPAGPKRLLFVAAMLILVSFGMGLWYTRSQWKLLLS